MLSLTALSSRTWAALTAFRQRLDGLNLFIDINNIPVDTAQRLRAYMHQQKSLQLREDAERSLPLLSLPLQIEVVRHVHRHWLTAIWFMKDLEEPAKIRMAIAMEPYVLAPREVAPTRRMYVIEVLYYAARSNHPWRPLKSLT